MNFDGINLCEVLIDKMIEASKKENDLFIDLLFICNNFGLIYFANVILSNSSREFRRLSS